jgi:hypothetical protein
MHMETHMVWCDRMSRSWDVCIYVTIMGEIVARIGWIYEPRPIELDVQQLNVVRFCRGAKQGRTQENLRVGTNQVSGSIAC